MKSIFLFVIASMAVLSGGCGNDSSVIPTVAAATLEGTWKRPINGMPGEFEGMTFSPDGHFGYINIHSMSGANWEQTGQQLKISSLTVRYPQLESSNLQIEKLTDTELVLTGEGYSGGSYVRDDNFGGLVTGSLLLGDNAALPEDAVLLVQLNDVSRADAPSVLIGSRVIPVAGKNSPFDWRVYYPAGKIEQRNRYSVSATIAYANHIQFRTTTSYGVITNDLPGIINIEAEKMPAKVEPSGKPIQGMYNYMADAALFMNCADGKTYPVAMAGDNANLERAYLELKAGDNAKVWIEVVGRLVEQTGMEGNVIQTALLVEKVMSVDKNKTCKPGPPDFGLAGKKWQLFEAPGSDLPADMDLSSAVLEFTTELRVSGSIGCNRINGGYTLNDYEIMLGEPMAMTRMACPGDLAKLESVVMDGLKYVDGYELKGDVLNLLIDGEPALRYKTETDAVTNVDAGLVGKWRLNTITGLSMPDDINPAEVAYIEFLADGKVAGKTGCNRLISSYTQDDDKLKFGIGAGTMMMCPPDFMQIESGMQKAIADTAAFTINDDALQLKNKEGAKLAVFNRATE